jgi:hypothetical protein
MCKQVQLVTKVVAVTVGETLETMAEMEESVELEVSSSVLVLVLKR